MSNYNLSANMSLPIPVVGQDPGPDWALNIDACLALLDGHDHTSGKGVQITPAAININTDLNFNSYNAIGLKSVRLSAQSALDATPPNLTCVYVIGADLYYNDADGNQIRITQSGSVAGASGTITGLPSGTASAAYNAISGTFIFQSASNTAANIDGGSIIIREVAASAKGITITSPSGLPANYSLLLPSSLPASQKFMTLDNAGNIAATWAVDNSTLEVNANSVRVKDLGITAAKIANATITTAQISASAGILGSQLSSSAGILGAQLSASANVLNSQLALFPFAYATGNRVNNTGPMTSTSFNANSRPFSATVCGEVTSTTDNTLTISESISGKSVSFFVPAGKTQCYSFTYVLGGQGSFTFSTSSSASDPFTGTIATNVTLLGY